jgi:hypothetical protein
MFSMVDKYGYNMEKMDERKEKNCSNTAVAEFITSRIQEFCINRFDPDKLFLLSFMLYISSTR